jgi:small nuclear ribonucleoprotein (snRNP)-like protein
MNETMGVSASIAADYLHNLFKKRNINCHVEKCDSFTTRVKVKYSAHINILNYDLTSASHLRTELLQEVADITSRSTGYVIEQSGPLPSNWQSALKRLVNKFDNNVNLCYDDNTSTDPLVRIITTRLLATKKRVKYTTYNLKGNDLCVFQPRSFFNLTICADELFVRYNLSGQSEIYSLTDPATDVQKLLRQWEKFIIRNGNAY